MYISSGWFFHSILFPKHTDYENRLYSYRPYTRAFLRSGGTFPHHLHRTIWRKQYKQEVRGFWSIVLHWPKWRLLEPSHSFCFRWNLPTLTCQEIDRQVGQGLSCQPSFPYWRVSKTPVSGYKGFATAQIGGVVRTKTPYISFTGRENPSKRCDLPYAPFKSPTYSL